MMIFSGIDDEIYELTYADDPTPFLLVAELKERIMQAMESFRESSESESEDGINDKYSIASLRW